MIVPFRTITFSKSFLSFDNVLKIKKSNCNGYNDKDYIRNFPIVNETFNYSNNINYKIFNDTFENKIFLEINENVNDKIEKFNLQKSFLKNNKLI